MLQSQSIIYRSVVGLPNLTIIFKVLFAERRGVCDGVCPGIQEANMLKIAEVILS